MTDASIPCAPLPVTRAQAKAENSMFYFTGKPCKYGHIAIRYAAFGACMECKKAREATPEYKAASAAKAKRYRAADPEWHAARNLEWRAANPEKVKARMARGRDRNREKLRDIAVEYYWANREKRLAANRAYRLARPGENYARVREWALANPERFRVLQAQRRARKRGAAGTYSAADIARQFELQAGYCFGCFADLTVVGYTVDHIVPLVKGGTNYPDNLQLLCKSCNCSKGAKDNAEWWAGRTKA